MALTNKTPARLTQISLVFSLFNFFSNGLNSSTILLFIVFTLSVYSSARIWVAVNQVQHSSYGDMSGLSMHLVIAAILFIGIATFTYSALFGVFYICVAAIYLISPQDRGWLAGNKQIVIVGNKIEYRDT